MSFFRYYLRDHKDNQLAVLLWATLFSFYVFMNLPYIIYIRDNAEVLSSVSPFYGAPFTINLFNFDPSMEYGNSTGTAIHPLYNFLSAPLTYISNQTIGNLLFLLLQSAINALSTVILYLIMRRSGSKRLSSTIFSLFFGVSSYSLFTALIPDSYPYAQFMIILSVAYLQKSRETCVFSGLPGAALTVMNFGITATNLITFAGALFINMFNPARRKESGTRFVKIMIGSLILLIMATILQYVLFEGKTWLSNLGGSMSNGAFGYVALFSFEQHTRVIHMLTISPILTPYVAMIDQNIVAFATDLHKPYPFYVHIIGLSLLLMSFLGFLKGIRLKETWSAAVYILFGLLLHVVIGFGLAAYSYDMYLYAGHYLFAIFLLAAGFVRDTGNRTSQRILIVLAALFVLGTLVNNVIRHIDTLEQIRITYHQIIDTSAK